MRFHLFYARKDINYFDGNLTLEFTALNETTPSGVVDIQVTNLDLFVISAILIHLSAIAQYLHGI